MTHKVYYMLLDIVAELGRGRAGYGNALIWIYYSEHARSLLFVCRAA